MVSIRVVAFLLLTSCGALCQQARDKHASTPLPDAPSQQVAEREETIRTVAAQASSPRVTAAAVLTHRAQPGFTFPDSRPDSQHPIRKESSAFFDKYLNPSLLKRNLNYHPSSGGSLMGRATYAASRILFTQDNSGRGSLNTSYFLAVLSSAAAHTAYRPYWRRSVSEPFSDFGSTIGNDAGMNLLHEFGPGLQQLMKSHAPKFVSRIEERLGASGLGASGR
jgi:hypothetical protein